MTEDRVPPPHDDGPSDRSDQRTGLPHADGGEGAVAVVSEFYEALLAEDAARAFGVFAADVAWYEMPGGPYARPDGTPYRGVAEIAQEVLSRQIDDVENLAMARHDVLVYGSSIIVLGTATGKGRKTGRRLEVPFAHVWTLKDRQIVEFRQYIDPVRFRAAVDAPAAVAAGRAGVAAGDGPPTLGESPSA